MGVFLGLVFEDVAQAHLVVVGIEGDAVVAELGAGNGDGRAGDFSGDGLEVVVYVQLHVFDELLAKGQASGGDIGPENTVAVYADAPCGAIVHVDARRYEGQELLQLAVNVDGSLIRGAAVSGMDAGFCKGRQIFPEEDFLHVPDKVREGMVAGEVGIQHVAAKGEVLRGRRFFQ